MLPSLLAHDIQQGIKQFLITGLSRPMASSMGSCAASSTTKPPG